MSLQKSGSIENLLLKIRFKVPSNPGTQPLLPKRRAWLLHQLAADLSIVHAVLVVDTYRIQKF